MTTSDNWAHNLLRGQKPTTPHDRCDWPGELNITSSTVSRRADTETVSLDFPPGASPSGRDQHGRLPFPLVCRQRNYNWSDSSPDRTVLCIWTGVRKAAWNVRGQLS